MDEQFWLLESLYCSPNLPRSSFYLGTVQGPVGLPGTRSFCVLHFFDYRKQPSFSLRDLPWVPMGRFKQLLSREGRGCEIREKQMVKSSHGARFWIPATDSHNILNCSVYTETHSRREKLTINDSMLPTSKQIPDELEVDDVDSYLFHQQLTRSMSMSWLHPFWTTTTKLLTIFPKGVHTVLRAWAHCVPLCPAKQQSSPFLEWSVSHSVISDSLWAYGL